MKRSTFMRIILIAGSALILIGMTLVGWMFSNRDKKGEIVVHLTSGETEIIEFESLSLVPGEQCEYTVKLKSSEKNIYKYKMKLDFTETEEKTLKQFARVKIISGEESVYDALLATAFEDDNIILPVDFAEEKNTELRVVYYMPLDVGNEAKNAEAIFDLLITASID